MGCGSSKVALLTVDDEEKAKEVETPKFDTNVFPVNREFRILKRFCQKHGIEQHHLMTVFKRYLTSDEAILRHYRVSVIDIKRGFLKLSRLNQVR